MPLDHPRPSLPPLGPGEQANISRSPRQPGELPEPCPGQQCRGRRSWRGVAAVPKALFRRADHAALPWLQAATAGEAGRRAAGRQGAAPVAPLSLGGAAPLLREPERGAQEGAGPGSALSSSETNNSSRGERSPSKPPAARARPAPAPGRSRPASLPALLPHMKQLQSRGFWGVGAGVCARVCECVCVFNSFPSLLPLPACSPACLPPSPTLALLHTEREGERERETHTHAHAHAGYMNGRREPIL